MSYQLHSDTDCILIRDSVAGYQGYLIMTDDWFNEYMFRLVVETKYASKKALEVLKQKPIRLPAWDPMFAE